MRIWWDCRTKRNQSKFWEVVWKAQVQTIFKLTLHDFIRQSFTRAQSGWEVEDRKRTCRRVRLIMYLWYGTTIGQQFWQVSICKYTGHGCCKFRITTSDLWHFFELNEITKVPANQHGCTETKPTSTSWLGTKQEIKYLISKNVRTINMWKTMPKKKIATNTPGDNSTSHK